MAGKTATETLTEEHRSIQKVVASMVVLADRLETGREVKSDILLEVVDFMRLVEKAHEGKEELYLFPMLERRGISVHSVPTRTLVVEHQKAKALVAKLEEGAAELVQGKAAPMALVESLRGLAALYPLHIWQEDLLLFHKASETLTLADDQELVWDFDRVDESAGGEVRDRLEELADRVQREAW